MAVTMINSKLVNSYSRLANEVFNLNLDFGQGNLLLSKQEISVSIIPRRAGMQVFDRSVVIFVETIYRDDH